MLGARPTYVAANRILGIAPEYGCPVFEDSGANCVYALNRDNHTHFYIAAHCTAQRTDCRPFGGMDGFVAVEIAIVRKVHSYPGM